MHFMETEHRRNAGLRAYDQSVTHLLESRGLQSHRWVLTHCGAAKPSDLLGFDAEETLVVVTPGAEARLGDPPADLRAISDLGLSVAIGTDGPCYNPRVDMFNEMRWLAYRHSLADHRLDYEELLAMATNTLWIGESCADLTFIRLDGATLHPIVRRPYSNALENLVWSATGCDVVGTLVCGQLLYWRDRWLEHDVESTLRRLTAQMSEFLGDTVGGKSLKLLCDAIPFCYGPATALKRVLSVWRPHCDEITLASVGTTIEYMRRSGLVDRVLEVDPEDVEAIRCVHGHWDVFVSICNPVAFAELRRLARFSVYWDFLLWMRYERHAAEFDADRYVVEMYPGSNEALGRWGPEIRHLVPCPVLADWCIERERVEGGLIVVSLGGQKSCLTNQASNTHYPSLMIEVIQEAACRVGNDSRFVVATNEETARMLGERYASDRWQFASFEHEAFLGLVRRSELGHPGLYAPFEIIGSGVPIYFLPSSNYTQVLQLALFEQVGIAPERIDWKHVLSQTVPFGLPESEGICRVMELVEQGWRCRDVRTRLVERVAGWLSTKVRRGIEVQDSQRQGGKRFFGDWRITVERLLDDARASQG
jgi:hypothetical protein